MSGLLKAVSVQRELIAKMLTKSLWFFFLKGAGKSELIRLMILDHEYRKAGIRQIYRDSMHFANKHLEQSIYFDAKDKDYLLLEDITKLKKEGINYWHMRRGVRGMMLIPVRTSSEAVGFIELSSSEAMSLREGDVESIGALSRILGNSASLFLSALKLDLDSLIQKHFTAIHPTVEWMFEDLAIEWLKGEDDKAIMTPIFLEKIFCLYGNSDIRGSSDLRQTAIRRDLYRQINLAAEIVSKSSALKPLEQMYHMSYKLNHFKETLTDHMLVNQESSIIQYLRTEFMGIIDWLKTLSPEIAELCTFYRSNLGESGAFFQHRKMFETSVHTLNLALNSLIDEDQGDLQKIYPHFFEKHITDGMEHSIYLGRAIDATHAFSSFHLKSLRIWQLKLLCRCAVLGEKIKSRLDLPLELAHLIVVQNEPVTIFFDLQEKRFKVEGTYNIRFEIVKKRIDKAMVKNSQTRLTQPGTIAVVYSVDSDRNEYMQYFQYLTDMGYLDSNWEDLILEDTPGIQGLRALRVAVDLKKLGEYLDFDSLLGKFYGLKK